MSNISRNESIVERFIKSQHLTEEQVARVSAQSASMHFIDLEHTPIAPDIFEQIPDDIAKRFRAVPVFDDGATLTVAVADPLDFEVLDALPLVLSRELSFVCATPGDIQRHLVEFYNADKGTADVLDDPTAMGARNAVAAATQVLDRVGIVKKEKVEVTSDTGGLFILPPKKAEDE